MSLRDDYIACRTEFYETARPGVFLDSLKGLQSRALRAGAEKWVQFLEARTAFHVARWNDAVDGFERVANDPGSDEDALYLRLWSLYNRGLALERLGGYVDAMVCFDSLMREYEGNEDRECSDWLAHASSHVARWHEGNAAWDAAAEAHHRVYWGARQSTQHDVQELGINSLGQVIMWTINRREYPHALELLEQMLHWVESMPDASPWREETRAVGLNNAAVLLGRLGKHTQAIRILDAVIAEFDGREDGRLPEIVATAKQERQRDWMEKQRGR